MHKLDILVVKSYGVEETKIDGSVKRVMKTTV